ncbi:MAG: methionyl-tRNA formyltransferase [Eggerthellaceae bacterium]|nr:methionyl-tRNA formyltransferase [Eggerthellaceae bacterium]
MRIVFMGTPEFSATILENLIGHHEVVAVFTRPDAVRGRGNKLVASPVKLLAEEAGVPVFTPRSLHDSQVISDLALLSPDAICVAAYGAILPQEILDLPRYGCLNVHASRLPAWRGAAPIEHAILAGDAEAGVCIMRMEAGMDTGDYCIVRTTEIGNKNTTELTAELADLGSSALLTALSLIEQGTVEWTKQDDFFATYADKIVKGQFFLKSDASAVDTVRNIQASSAAHPARAIIAGRPVTVTSAARVTSRLLRADLALEAGQAILHQKKLYLGMGDQPIEVLELKPDGKREMTGAQFAAGVPSIKQGAVWEACDV